MIWLTALTIFRRFWNSAATATCDTTTFVDLDNVGEYLGEKYPFIRNVLPGISPTTCVSPQLWYLRLHLRRPLWSVPEHSCPIKASTMSSSFLKASVSILPVLKGISSPLKSTIYHHIKVPHVSFFEEHHPQSAWMERMEHSDVGIDRYRNTTFRQPFAAQRRTKCDSGWYRQHRLSCSLVYPVSEFHSIVNQHH